MYWYISLSSKKKKKKSLTIEGLPGWGDHIHTGPGSLRSGLPKPAGFRTENLTNVGGTKVIQGY